MRNHSANPSIIFFKQNIIRSSVDGVAIIGYMGYQSALTMGTLYRTQAPTRPGMIDPCPLCRVYPSVPFGHFV